MRSLLLLTLSTYRFILFHLGRFIYHWFHPDSPWCIKNIFIHPFSKVSLLFNGMALGLSLILRTWNPVFIMSSATTGGFLLLKILFKILFKIKEKYDKPLFNRQQKNHVPAPVRQEASPSPSLEFALMNAVEKNNWDLALRLMKNPNMAFNMDDLNDLVLSKALSANKWDVIIILIKKSNILSAHLITEEKSLILSRLCSEALLQKKMDVLDLFVKSDAYTTCNLQRKLEILKLSAQQNYPAILITILNRDVRLVENLDINVFIYLFQLLSLDTLNKMSPHCAPFVHAIQERYRVIPLSIADISIMHLLPIHHLDSLDKVALFFKDILEFLKIYAQNKEHAVLALEILLFKSEYSKNKAILENQHDQNHENAQLPDEVLSANQAFEKIKNHYQEEFFAKKNASASSLEVIEREIKSALLTQMVLEAKENITKKYQKQTCETIIHLISKNKIALLNSQESCTKQLFQALKKLIPHHISAVQTAWLSYDASHNVDPKGWKFLVNPSNERTVYTTAEATQTRSNFTNRIASEQVRLRIAYYWLAINDPLYPDVDNFRLGNFFGIISSIYRTNGFGASCCFPGHLSNIAKMGLYHPIAETITVENLIDHALISPVLEAFKNELEANSLTWTIEDKENILSSLTYVNEGNAEQLFHLEMPSPISLTFQHTFSKKYYAEITSKVLAEILQNDRYAYRVLSETERDLIENGIQYKIRSISSNPFISSGLNDLILASSCTKQDLNFEEMSPFPPGSSRYQLYLTLTSVVHHQFDRVFYNTLPSIQTLNQITTLCGELTNHIIDKTKMSDTLKQLTTLGFTIDLSPKSQVVLFQFKAKNRPPQEQAQEKAKTKLKVN